MNKKSLFIGLIALFTLFYCGCFNKNADNHSITEAGIADNQTNVIEVEPWAQALPLQQDLSVSIRLHSFALAADGIIIAGQLGAGTYFTGDEQITINASSSAIAKYSDNGSIIWLKIVTSGKGRSYFNSATVAPDGSVYAIGKQIFASTFDYGGFTIATPSGGFFPDKLVLVKYASDGTTLWAQTIGEDDSLPYYNAVSAAPDGSIIVVGYQYNAGNSVNIGVIKKYDKDGALQWTKSVHSKNSWHLSSVIAASDGIYAVGDHQGTVDHGNGVIIKSNNNRESALVIKYDYNGKVLWGKSVTGGKGSEFNAISAAPDGSVYAVGNQWWEGIYNYEDKVTVKNESKGNNSVIVKYSGDGKTLWARTVEGDDHSRYTSVIASVNGVYVAGYQSGISPYSYGNNIVLHNNGLILVKYDSNGRIIWAEGDDTGHYGRIYSIADAGGFYTLQGYTVSKNLTSVINTGVDITGTAVGKQKIVYRNGNGTVITDTPLSVIKATPAPTFSSITADSAGNTYAVGYQGENEISDFGDNLKTVNDSLDSAFIIKYDKTGKAQWVKNITGGGRSYFLSVAAAPDGIYAAGFQYGSQPFDYGDNITVNSNNKYDVSPNAVLVKYDNNGKTLWAKSVSYLSNQEKSSGESLFKAVAVANDGGVYVAGHQDSENAADYGNGKTIMTKDNSVIIKYDRDGNAQWVKNVKGGGSAQYNAIAAAPDNGIYVAGKQTFHAGYAHPPGDTLEYGGITTEGYHMENGPLLIKYDSEGNALWVKTIVARDAQYNTLKVAPGGSIYVAGSIHSNSSNLIVDLGDNVTVTANKYKTVAIIAKYSPDGDTLWARTADIDNSSLFNSISVTANGDVYAVGGLTGKSSASDYSHNKKTAVIHKYDSQGNKLWEETAIGEHSSMFRSSAYIDGKVILTGEQYGQGIYDYGSVEISAPSPYKNTVIMMLQDR